MNTQLPTPFHGEPSHVSVLLSESLQGLAIKPDGRYVDLTFGAGGHAQAILAQLSPQGRLLAFDRDPAAAPVAAAMDDPRLIFRSMAFDGLMAVLQEMEWGAESVDGILMDLGVSSMQLDEAARGFSFRHDGPLDMRMDPRQGESAELWLAQVTEKELARVFRVYGEETMAKAMARAVVRARQIAPITRTEALADVIAACVPAIRRSAKHPATRAFQAIRIQVNQELPMLERTLPQCAEALKPSGRLAVISFHSLEDRLVKDFIHQAKRQAEALQALLPRGIPILTPAAYDNHSAPFHPLGRAVLPSAAECAVNRRARSAKMRLAEKLPRMP